LGEFGTGQEGLAGKFTSQSAREISRRSSRSGSGSEEMGLKSKQNRLNSFFLDLGAMRVNWHFSDPREKRAGYFYERIDEILDTHYAHGIPGFINNRRQVDRGGAKSAKNKSSLFV
jgi:hypothetical protein